MQRAAVVWAINTLNADSLFRSHTLQITLADTGENVTVSAHRVVIGTGAAPGRM